MSVPRAQRILSVEIIGGLLHTNTKVMACNLLVGSVVQGVMFLSLCTMGFPTMNCFQKIEYVFKNL